MNSHQIDLLLPLKHPMIYYLLPNSIKKRCIALKRISLEHEALDIKYRKERRSIYKRYSIESFQGNDDDDDDEDFVFKARHQISSSLDEDDGSERGLVFALEASPNPLGKIVEKADDLKVIAQGHFLEESTSLSLDLYRSNEMKQLLANCETKCNELLTHLANIDWELENYEQSIVAYHEEIESVMVRYNKELNELYERRLDIIKGTCENEVKLMPREYLERYLGKRWDYNYITNERFYPISYSEEMENLFDDKIRGVPKFWINSIKLALNKLNLIKTYDEDPLSYLIDVRYYYDTEHEQQQHNIETVDGRIVINSDYRAQLLLFYFEKNPYFSNRILSKTFHIDKSRQSGYRMFDDVWVTKREGCAINWLDGIDLTKHEFGQREVGSFFNFFTESGLGRNRFVKRQLNNKEFNVELDYDVFARFRDFIVPHAIIAYSRANLFGVENEEKSSGKKMYYLNEIFS